MNPQKLTFQPMRGGARGEVVISGMFVLGGSGAVASADGFAKGLTAGPNSTIKVAGKTARYTVTLDRKYKSLRFLGAPGIVGDTNTAFGNTNANAAQFRNRTTSSFDIQLMLASSGADTDGVSGYEVHWSVVVRLI